jgi:hypothetical protein
VKLKYKATIVLALISFINICKAQSDTTQNELYDKEFNWRIKIPSTFKRLDLTDDDFTKLQQRGKGIVEKSVKGKLENHAKTIYLLKADRIHYFESNSLPYNPAIDGNYLAGCKQTDKILYRSMSSQVHGAKIDSASSTETIDKLTFQKFSMLVTLPNNKVLTMLMYNRLFGKKELTVNIVYTDKTKGDLLLTAWRNSKFE